MNVPHPGSENEPTLEALQAKVRNLEAQLGHDNETRKELLEATGEIVPALAKSRQQWEAMMQATLNALRRAPEIGELRGDQWHLKYAQLATRLRALEENTAEGFHLIMTRQSVQDELLDKIAAGISELRGLLGKIAERQEGLQG